MEENKPSTIQVALRVRPLSENEETCGCKNIANIISGQPQIKIADHKSYTFNYVFGPYNSQLDIYQTAIKPMLNHLYNGYNVTILAYGQTGSGKTYTMGTGYDMKKLENFDKNNSFELTEDLGIIPRAVFDIFEKIKENGENSKYETSVSFIELYNENVYDLLAEEKNVTGKDKCMVYIREENGHICIQNLTEKIVGTPQDLFANLIKGSKGRVTGATAMNSTSSRSHAIFTIKLTQTCFENNLAKISKFTFVDLAGSERPKRTQAVGERFKEGVNINYGLFILGNVISLLGDDKLTSSYIPYRDSKLTRILQDSLGGNSFTLMIACVSPADSNLDETINTLKYADRAKKIKNKPIVNEVNSNEVLKLKQVIENLKSKLTERGDSEELLNENKRLKEELDMLKDKNRVLRDQLQKTLYDNTILNDRQIFEDNNREKLKQHFNDLQMVMNDVKNELDLPPDKQIIFESIEKKFGDLLDGVKQEENQQTMLIIEQSVKMSDSIINQINNDENYVEISEAHAQQHLQLNQKLNDLQNRLALKEKLAKELQQMQQIDIDYKAIKDAEEKISHLEKERDQLLQQLKIKTKPSTINKSGKNDNNDPTQAAKQKRIEELEYQISDLQRKVRDHEKLIKQKEKSDEKIRFLNRDILQMKQDRVKLVKQMKNEMEKYKTWKMERERELCKLKNQDRKLQTQLVKLESMHAKQQNVLKRKYAEATAANKRLKDALALQKTTQNRPGGKTQRINQMITENVEFFTSCIRAEVTLESLIDTRRELTEKRKELLELYKLEQNVDLQNQLGIEMNDLDKEIELQSNEISDLKLKLSDSDFEAKLKTQWDTIFNIHDAKSTLQHVFNLFMDLKKSDFIKQDQIVSYQERIDELNQQIQTLENDICRLNEKVQYLETQQGNASSSVRNVENNEEETIDEDNNQTTGEGQKRKVTKKLQSNSIFEELVDTSIELVDDDTNDPDWTKTPLYKRHKEKLKLGPQPTTGVKRFFFGDVKTKCQCTKDCKTKKCACKKLNQICTNNCSCNVKTSCINRETNGGDGGDQPIVAHCSKILFSDENNSEISSTTTETDEPPANKKPRMSEVNDDENDEPNQLNVTFVQQKRKFFK